MLLTPSEAHSKVCPVMTPGFSVNLSNSAGGSYSGMANPNVQPMCRGEQCMAWRWGDDMKSRGYCGMAGQP